MTQPAEALASLHTWLSAPLTADVRKTVERIRAAPDVAHVALMPDVHLAREVCIGTVLATRQRLYPQAVGNDIGCGMAALAFDGEAALLGEERAAGRLLAALPAAVPVMRQARARMAERLPEPLHSTPLSAPGLERLKPRDARVQLGTLGRGNHFLEFQADDDGRLWLMVHSGSRAVGQAIAQHHLALAEPTGGGLRSLAADSPTGAAYLADVEWALAYARENRRRMVTAVAETLAQLFGVRPVEASIVECDHNHVRHEEHWGTWWWVHRKGAVSAADGQPGIIPGSMGTASFHVVGRGCPEALHSSAHGAGRCMSRDEARRRVSVKSLERQMCGVWFDHRAGRGLCAEAPQAYRDIEAVMLAQQELTRIVRRLRPVLVYKGA